jgi:hypothetical protein
MEPLSPFTVIAQTAQFPDQLFASQQPMYPSMLPFSDDMGDDIIFSETRINEIKSKGTLHTYFRALVETNMRRSNECSVRLGKVFAFAIKSLKTGTFTLSQSKELISCLQLGVPFLGNEDIPVVLDKLLNHFRPDSSTHASIGHVKSLELLPYLISRSSSLTRLSTIERICNLRWDSHSSLMLAATLGDLCESQKECELAMDKIRLLVVWENGSRSEKVDLEDLPGLLYNLTVIGSKVNVPELKLNVLTIIADSIDSLAKCLHGNRNSSMEATQIQLVDHATKINIGNILGTIVCHLTLLISKDRELSLPMNLWIKQRRLFSGSNIGGSCARLVLCLIAASSSHADSKLIVGIRDFIHLVIEKENKALQSIWFQRHSWSSLIAVSAKDLTESFSLLIMGPFLQTGLVQALVALAFQLLGLRSTWPKSIWGAVGGATLRCTPSIYSCISAAAPDTFGEWILVTLFQQCDYTRGPVCYDFECSIM